MEQENQFQLTDLFLPRKVWNRIRKPVISLFVLLHFSLIYCCYQRANLLASATLNCFQKYVLFIGLEQGFDVFAPSPRRTNVHVVASITYADGTTRVWPFPRMDRMPLIDKLFKERFRKFLNDNVTSERWPNIYDDIARFAARQTNSISDNPPVVVSIISYKSDIPPIRQNIQDLFEKEEEKTVRDFRMPRTIREIEEEKLQEKEEKEKSARKEKEGKPWTRNRFGNPLNPPNYQMKVLTTYRVKPEDLQ